MSLRRRDRIDDLIQACELRREKAETLKQQKKFSWGKAATALRNHRKPIKKVADFQDLMKVKKLCTPGTHVSMGVHTHDIHVHT